MNFCENCGNMYYLKISSENNNQLIYNCRKCGNTDSNLISDDNGVICVSKTHIKKTKQSYNSIINKYTKLDPTLPRIRNMKCPNVECPSNNVETKQDALDTDEENNVNNEILFMRYDNDNMKYVYLCTECDYSWKNN